MDIMTYVKPELLVLTIVLYFIGVWIKKSQIIKNKYIPLTLGIIGVVLATIWVFGTSSITGWSSGVMALFVGIVQGVLVSGLSTYTNQMWKQKGKNE